MPEPITLEFEFRNKRFKDAAAGLRAFADDIESSWASAPAVLRKELRDFLDTVAEAMSRRHGMPWPMGTGPKSLAARSGYTLRYIKESVLVAGSSLDNVWGSISIPYTRSIHETGGIIRARHAKYLTIPLPAALKSNGVPIKRSASGWRDTFIIKSKKGNLLIVRKKGNSIEPLYVLKKEVKIPKRMGMQDTLDAGLPYFVDRAGEAILKALLK